MIIIAALIVSAPILFLGLVICRGLGDIHFVLSDIRHSLNDIKIDLYTILK